MYRTRGDVTGDGSQASAFKIAAQNGHFLDKNFEKYFVICLHGGQYV
jgi:hypothetical protein